MSQSAVPPFSAPGPMRALIAALAIRRALRSAQTPPGAQVLTPAQRGELEALRGGDMRKLVVHAEPAPTPMSPSPTARARIHAWPTATAACGW